MGEGAICLKYSTLVLITVETSAMVLLLRFSRKQNIDSEDSYINSTAVFLSEFTKIFICIFVIAAKIAWQSHYVRPVSGGMKLPLSVARAARVKSPVSVADEYASRR